jgi:magnesium transporter
LPFGNGREGAFVLDQKTHEQLFEDIQRFLLNHDQENLNHLMEAIHPADIAEVLMDIEMEARVLFFNLTSKQLSSHVFLEMDESTKARVLEQLERDVVSDMVSEMESDDAADVLSELSDAHQEEILDGMDDANSDKIEPLLSHDEETAGHLMQSEFLVAPENATVENVISGLEEIRDSISHWSSLYVVDGQMKLKGILPIQELLFADQDSLISDICQDQPPFVYQHEDQEEVAKLFRKYDLLSLPVVDTTNRISGVITVDDIIDVIDEEHQEDTYRMAGVSEGASTYSGFWESIVKRLPWLGVNLVTASLACSIIGFYEDIIAQIAIIAVFLPIVAALGGNAGSQTVTVIVRAIAMGHIRSGRILRVILKELAIGLLNGLAIGMVGGAAAYLIIGTDYLLISIVFVLALWANITVATLLGTVIPITLKRFNLDPAYSSVIFLTLFTDGVGFFVFLILVNSLWSYIVR